MTLLCVPILVESTDQARRDIVHAVEAGADVIELRVDHLTDPADIILITAGLAFRYILTCRPTWEGGESTLDEQSRFALLRQAAESIDNSSIDIEWKTLKLIALRDPRPTLIVSSHDFSGFPDRFYNTLTDLSTADADVTKVVWLARSIRDNLIAFEMLESKVRPTIALCMGEAGLLSRVLAKKFGAFLTFASLRDASATAPGQVTVAEMKRLYRWDMIGRATRVYGVVGSPIMHSMSPAIHNAAFTEADYDGVYLPMLVNPGYESFKAFAESFVAMGSLHLSGLSVTIPHKENALRWLKERNATIEPLADAIGAVNTIKIERVNGLTHLSGFNTDYAAILDTLAASLASSRSDLSKFRFAVIGAGGTGRTAVAALAHLGATIVIYNRTRERAVALAAEFNGKTGKVVAADMDKLCDSCCHVYINTTPIGMHPKIDATPFGNTLPKFTPETLVFDTIYNPIETRLIREAKAAGAKTVGGVEMFVRQAAGQFVLWTGKAAPLELMRSTVVSKLSDAV